MNASGINLRRQLKARPVALLNRFSVIVIGRGSLDVGSVVSGISFRSLFGAEDRRAFIKRFVEAGQTSEAMLSAGEFEIAKKTKSGVEVAEAYHTVSLWV